MDDIGFLEFNTSRDLYEKMCHDFEMLRVEKNSNNYMNFILVVNHLKDWMKYDCSFSEESKKKANILLKKSNYKLFKDLANRSKHFIIDRKSDYFKYRETETKDVFYPSLDFSNADFDKWNFGEDAYLVEQDGKRINLFDSCKKIYDAYKHIFEFLRKKD